MILATLLISLLFAAIHLLAGKMRFIRVIPRSAWLSAAGGISVAYVFIHLLPEAEEFGRRVHKSGVLEETTLGRLTNPVYLLVLLGLVVFYGLERWVVHGRSGRGAGRGERKQARPEEDTPPGIFWLHIGSFALYNVLITYLLVRESELEPGRLATFAVAMGLHYLVNDFGLREHHRHLYHARGRWILAVAAPVGWLIGVLLPLHVTVTSSLFGFLCGATVLNVLKEELPAERESRFWAFATGAGAFTGLLLFV